MYDKEQQQTVTLEKLETKNISAYEEANMLANVAYLNIQRTQSNMLSVCLSF